MLSAWLLWFLLACIPVIPVLLRLAVGDDPPSNETVHESGDGQDPPGPAFLPVAA